MQVKMTTRLEKVFNAYASRQGVESESLRFFFEGTRLNADSTPGDYGMVDGDKMYVIPEQSGD